MAQQPLASKGNYFHIYDFWVKPGMGDKFLKEFEDFDYSDDNPMHKSPAQVKDGVMLQDVEDADHFYLIAEWADIEEHARIRQVLVEMAPDFVNYIRDLDKGAFVPKYAKIVSSTPQHLLDEAASG